MRGRRASWRHLGPQVWSNKRENAMTFDRRALPKIACASGLTALAAPVGAADDGTLVQSIEALRKAMLTKDKGQFEILCADELSYGHSSGKLESKAEFIRGATSPKWH